MLYVRNLSSICCTYQFVPVRNPQPSSALSSFSPLPCPFLLTPVRLRECSCSDATMLMVGRSFNALSPITSIYDQMMPSLNETSLVARAPASPNNQWGPILGHGFRGNRQETCSRRGYAHRHVAAWSAVYQRWSSRSCEGRHISPAAHSQRWAGRSYRAQYHPPRRSDSAIRDCLISARLLYSRP